MRKCLAMLCTVVLMISHPMFVFAADHLESPVNQDTAGTMVGAKCTYGLKRTTSDETWKFSVNCPVVTNAIAP